MVNYHVAVATTPRLPAGQMLIIEMALPTGHAHGAIQETTTGGRNTTMGCQPMLIADVAMVTDVFTNIDSEGYDYG